MRKTTWGMLGLGLIVALGLGVGTVMADSNSNAPSKIAQAIASKFNLNVGDVQGVIDSQRQQNKADRQTVIKARLDAAVKAGTITQSQEDALIQKLSALRQSRQAGKSARVDLQQWLKDNNLKLRSLLSTKAT